MMLELGGLCSSLCYFCKYLCLLVVFFFLPGVDRLALIIPWVVLQELDNLKKGKMLQHVRDKAIPAVQFIYKCLKNQDSKLWGQSMQLASQKMCNTCAIHLCWVLHPCTSPSGNLRIWSLMETSLCSLLIKMT